MILVDRTADSNYTTLPGSLLSLGSAVPPAAVTTAGLPVTVGVLVVHGGVGETRLGSQSSRLPGGSLDGAGSLLLPDAFLGTGTVEELIQLSFLVTDELLEEGFLLLDV